MEKNYTNVEVLREEQVQDGEEAGKVEKQEPQGPSSPGAFEEWYDTKFKHGFERGPNDKYVARKAWFAALYTAPQPCPECEKLKAERAKSESTWESLDNERVQYMNEVGDVLGQNNTDESLIGAAKRAMQTIEFQKKAWSADFVRMTRMEAAIERMRTAGGKDEFQKAFDDAKALL